MLSWGDMLLPMKFLSIRFKSKYLKMLRKTSRNHNQFAEIYTPINGKNRYAIRKLIIRWKRCKRLLNQQEERQQICKFMRVLVRHITEKMNSKERKRRQKPQDLQRNGRQNETIKRLGYVRRIMKQKTTMKMKKNRRTYGHEWRRSHEEE